MPRGWPVVLVLLALGAGCVAEDAPPAPAPEVAPANATLPDAPPDNRTGEFNAFEETNKTEEGVGGLDHDHDYWLGRDRVDVVTGRYEMRAFPTVSGVVAVVRPAPGALVYEGAAAVEVLVADPERHVCQFTVYDDRGPWCSDRLPRGQEGAPRAPDPAPPPLALAYQHAATKEWVEAGALVWGEPLVLEVAPEETDMPHSSNSLWRFRVASADPKDATLTFELTVTAVRGRDVPEWPGHPDFYADSDTRLVFDGVAATHEPGLAGYVAGEEASLELKAPTRLVSHGTRALHVWANVTRVEAAPGVEVTAWYLEYHNATGDWQDAEAVGDAGKDATALRFVIPVDEDGMDSPYASESRWEFMLRGVTATGVATCYGCAEYRVEYTLVVLATNVPPPT